MDRIKTDRDFRKGRDVFHFFIFWTVMLKSRRLFFERVTYTDILLQGKFWN